MIKNLMMMLLLPLLLPATAMADSPYYYDNYDFEVDGIYYKIEGSVACVTFQRYATGVYISDYHGDVVIPSIVTYQDKTYPVTIIDSNAFICCYELTSVTIPESITLIRSKAFDKCFGLTRVTINDLAAWCNMDIQSNPLYYAQHLYLNDTEVTDLTIPDGITAIRDYAFGGCAGLKSVTIPNSVTSIGNNAFEDCSGLTNITIPNSVTEIGAVAFECCTSLTSVTLGNAVKTIGHDAFSGCTALSDIIIPNSVTAIGARAFDLCTSLTSVTLSNRVSSIGVGTFYGCTSLTGIDIPDSVTAIGSSAFEGCTSLASVTLGKSVTTIGEYAFSKTSAIETITCKATTPPSWGAMSIFTANVYNNASLHVPTASEEAYKSSQYWGQFQNIIGDVTIDIPGDLDGDGLVTISDADNVVVIIINGGNGHDRTIEHDKVAGDVNGDGMVNITDLNLIINTIINH